MTMPPIPPVLYGLQIRVRPGDLVAGNLKKGVGREILKKRSLAPLRPLLQAQGLDLGPPVLRRIREEDLLRLEQPGSGQFLADLGERRLKEEKYPIVSLGEVLQDAGGQLPDCDISLPGKQVIGTAWPGIYNAEGRRGLFLFWDDASKLTAAQMIESESPEFYREAVIPYFRGELTIQRQQEILVKQLRDRGIKDSAVLKAIGLTPRERFVPANFKEHAYADAALPIAQDQRISQPYMVALMTEALRLTGKEKVLEVGAGSGYQAAILARLSSEVFTIEIISELAQGAAAILAELGITNVKVVCGGGSKGLPESAPFDRILITAACEEVPQPLLDQLADGGILVAPVGPQQGHQTLTIITRQGKQFQKRTACYCNFVPLIKD